LFISKRPLRMLPHKPPTRRAFRGLAGSPLAVVDEPAEAAVAVAEPESAPVFELDYDKETYREEINKALAYAKTLYKNGSHFIKRNPLKREDRIAKFEGQKDFEDLVQLIDIEIWKATKKYGDKMSPALAYRIAKNQAMKAIGIRIDRSESAVFSSLNELAPYADGEEPEASVAEVEIAKRGLEGRPNFEDFLLPTSPNGKGPQPHNQFRVLIDAGVMDRLRELVKTWGGDKRTVALAVLEADFTVRGIPGISKSKVSRLRQNILAEFKVFITERFCIPGGTK
jgi:hypothetical protein